MTTYRVRFDQIQPPAVIQAETMDDLTRAISDHVRPFLDTDDFVVSVYEDIDGYGVEGFSGSIEDGRYGSFEVDVLAESGAPSTSQDLTSVPGGDDVSGTVSGGEISPLQTPGTVPLDCGYLPLGIWVCGNDPRLRRTRADFPGSQARFRILHDRFDQSATLGLLQLIESFEYCLDEIVAPPPPEPSTAVTADWVDVDPHLTSLHELVAGLSANDRRRLADGCKDLIDLVDLKENA